VPVSSARSILDAHAEELDDADDEHERQDGEPAEKNEIHG
jgi:hypothetical protein